MHRFLLAENPMREGRVFVLHTITPKCLIECCEPDSDPKSSGYPHEIFQYKNSDGVNETWALIIRDVYDNSGNEELSKLLKKAWHWYKSYLEFEDKNIEDTDNEQFLGTVN